MTGNSSMNRSKLAGAALILTALAASPALALPTNLITNGNFSTTSNVTSPYSSFQIGYNGTLNGWTNQIGSGSTVGYSFLFTPGATGQSSVANGNAGNIRFWGTNNPGYYNAFVGSAPTETLADGTIGGGGNFVASDGGYQTAALTQSVNLLAGQTYTLSFWWAAAQQSGFSGATTDGWVVSLGGNQIYQTTDVTNPSQGSTPWAKVSVTFKATVSGSQTLSFLARGTPSGVPPFSLLDNVSLFAVPEPSSWGMMGVGLLGLGMVGLRRRARDRVA